MKAQIAAGFSADNIRERAVQGPRLQGAPSSLYSNLLNGSFVLFSSTRLFTYLPTTWAIHSSGDSTQHSLWTWLAWVCSNASMAAWLYENNGRRFNKAIAVVAGNAAMCLATSLVIVIYRL